MILARCQRLQDEQEIFMRGDLPAEVAAIYDGTVSTLIKCYQRDKDSPYQGVRYHTQVHYDGICRRIDRDCGKEKVAEIDVRRVKRLHETWTENGAKIPMAHALVTMMRTLLSYGGALLKDKACTELMALLHAQKFKAGGARSSILTAEQADAIRAEAHRQGHHSIALAQAFQFECMLRQKDVIGEWIPIYEPGPSDVFWGGAKWGRGIRWQEITEQDGKLILTHTTSKKLKEIEVNLRIRPMVMEELALLTSLPASGPVIVREDTGRPWSATEFRTKWREIARAVGVPDSVRSMDSRAGAITEATEAGVPLEFIQQAATHSDISTTQRYARSRQKKTEATAEARAAHRNASKTK